MVVVVFLVGAPLYAGLAAQHHRNTCNHEDNHDVRDKLLRVEKVDINRLVLPIDVDVRSLDAHK
jgi:hypothetical protein